MADNLQPAQGEEREVSSSGLLLSVDPLPGTPGYKFTTDDTDGGRDSTDVSGDDSDASDADGSDGSDSDDPDNGDADGTDGDGSSGDGEDGDSSDDDEDE